jgi:hypothetical protein
MRCRPLLIAGVLVAAACGPDTTATPSDSDSADEQAEPDDGDASAGPPDVVPGEIAGVVDLPESFEPYARGRAETGDTHTVTVEGELEGELGATVAWVADALREASWNAIEHDRLVEDRPIRSCERGDLNPHRV